MHRLGPIANIARITASNLVLQNCLSRDLFLASLHLCCLTVAVYFAMLLLSNSLEVPVPCPLWLPVPAMAVLELDSMRALEFRSHEELLMLHLMHTSDFL